MTAKELAERAYEKYMVDSTETSGTKHQIGEVEMIEDWFHCPGGLPIFNILKDDIRINIDYNDYIPCNLEIDKYNNDGLIPIIIYHADKKIGEIYRKLNNGTPYHDEDIIEMLAVYTGIDNMEEIFRKMDECFE